MTSEEPSSNPPQSASSRPPLSRADVAIGSLSRQLVRRHPSLLVDRPLTESDSLLDATAEANLPSIEPLTPVYEPQTVVMPQPSQQVQPAMVQMPEPIPVLAVSQPPTAIAEAPNATLAPPMTTKNKWQLPAKRIVLPALVAVALFAVGSGVFAWVHYENSLNTPQKIFSDALQASLSTNQIASQTVLGSVHDSVSYDFSNPINPVVSTQQTASMDGATFRLAGYGSASNTYVSYTKFPALVSSNITSLATNGWVQLRNNGRLPSGVTSMLADASDPRYQTIGLLTFGNFSALTKEQLIKYLLSENIYKYNLSRVTDTTLNGVKVLAYPVSINLNFLQIFDESVATDEGFSPSDVQNAINALANWSGARATFYVSAVSHRFVSVALMKEGVKTTIDYTNYDNVSMPGQPETKLTWDDFAPVQNMINEQVAPRSTVLTTKSVTKTTPATIKQ
jgi:hypothetical protein